MRKFKYILLWFFAFVLTIIIAYYQRKTGPTYPIDGESKIGAETFKYSLKRSHGGESDHPVSVVIKDKSVSGFVLWKHYKLNEPVKYLKMNRVNDTLIAYLPHQPPAGKLEYQLNLIKGNESITIPENKPVIIRFKGDVPLFVLIPHIIFMFGAMFIALTAFFSSIFNFKIKLLTIITFIFLSAGGLILGPIVQKYAFNAYWTGWPVGEDLTDNKTLLSIIFWLIALLLIIYSKSEKIKRVSVIVASIVMFGMYLIPHSMRGSEIDYSKLPQDSLIKILKTEIKQQEINNRDSSIK